MTSKELKIIEELRYQELSDEMKLEWHQTEEILTERGAILYKVAIEATPPDILAAFKKRQKGIKRTTYGWIEYMGESCYIAGKKEFPYKEGPFVIEDKVLWDRIVWLEKEWNNLLRKAMLRLEEQFKMG